MTEDKNKEKEIPVEFIENSQSETRPEEEQPQMAEAESVDYHPKKGKRLKDEHKKKLEEFQKKYDELNEQNLRLRAEFSNYKKRVDREQLELADYMKGVIIKKFLPIMDDFDRMLKVSDVEVNNGNLLTGAQLIFDKFTKIISELGVEKIDAIGKDFNPQIHEAIRLQEVEEEEKNGKIISVFQDGYLLGERLLRASKVVVGQFEKKEVKN